MENSVPQAEPQTAGGGRLSAQPKELTRLDQVVETGARILGQAQQIEHRLHLVVERLQGDRPAGSDCEKAIDPPGRLGAIEAHHSESMQTLDRCLGWITELEGQV